MGEVTRRTFVKGLGAAVSLAPGVLLGKGVHAEARGHSGLTDINRNRLVSEKEAHAWHVLKDSMGGPTIAGSPSWKNFLAICEKELRACGVVDVFRNPWAYTRWSTTEWPDDSNWSLQVDGEKVKVASYGCNSGSTPDDGVTGELVLYEEGMNPERLRGKIAVIVKGPSAGVVRTGDYEYLSTPETFPNPLRPGLEDGKLSPFLQMGTYREIKTLSSGGAIGALLVLDLGYEAVAGTYTLPVPPLHNMPTLYIDVDTGGGLVSAAKSGKKATLRLIAETEESETYQLFGYLPGKNYGTDQDEQILLITHTDGPSISQDNGAFGILGVVKYFANIPQEERPRTLMVFLDCRHYMPGMDRAFAKQDYGASHPKLYDKVIAAMGLEHLGQIAVEETSDDPYRMTDQAELSTVWVTNNQRLVDMAIEAINDNDLKRVQVQCPGRPGMHGGEQGGPWRGLGNIAQRIGVPGVSTMGLMTAYWSSRARLDYFDAAHFVSQVATMSQICGELMLVDIQRVATQQS